MIPLYVQEYCVSLAFAPKISSGACLTRGDAVVIGSHDSPGYVRNWVQISSSAEVPGAGDKLMTCDDFVLPRSPHSASFTVETYPAYGGRPSDGYEPVEVLMLMLMTVMSD